MVEEKDEEEDQQIDDQEESSEIGQVILEEREQIHFQDEEQVYLPLADLPAMAGQLTLEKNSEIKKHFHQKKSLVYHPRIWTKKVIDQKESLVRKKSLEQKNLSE
ncbi:MAG: hypothetical protein WCL02_03430 [bacterium]